MKFLNWLLGKKDKKVYTHIDEETIKRDEQIKGLTQKIAGRDAQLAKHNAKEKDRIDKEKLKDKESERNKKLKEKYLDLKANRYGKIIKLSKFYTHLLKSKKFAKRLEITDKNDEVVLGKFGDFVILEGGKLGLIDSEGNLLSYGKSLHHVLYKPDGFENQARRGRFTIPMDKDGNWMEDLEYKELPEPIDAEFDEETGNLIRINWSRVKISEVKKIIADKLEQINRLQGEMERQDSVMIDLKQEIRDLRRTKLLYEKQSDINQSEFSKAVFRFHETEKRLGELQSMLTKYSELKATYENLLDKKDSIIDKVLDKLDMTAHPQFQRIKDELVTDLRTYKSLLPEKIEIKEESRPEPRITVQPGEIIRK